MAEFWDNFGDVIKKYFELILNFLKVLGVIDEQTIEDLKELETVAE